MLSRLVVVCVLTVSVMAPLVWAAFQPVPIILKRTTPGNGPPQRDTTALRKEPPQSISFSTNASSSSGSQTVGAYERPVATTVAMPHAPTGLPEPRVHSLAKPGPLTDQDRNERAPSSPQPIDDPSQDTTASVTTALAPKQTSHPSRAERKHIEPQRDAFDVIDLYTGPHIIIVCSKLTKTQKDQMGCP
jgi:hypothetical protein